METKEETNNHLATLPPPVYEPDKPIDDNEFKHIFSWIKYDKDGKRITTDKEILQWILGRRIRVLSTSNKDFQMAWQTISFGSTGNTTKIATV